MGVPEIPNPSPDEGRRRVAQMLHDGPCQTFGSAHLLAEILLRDAEAGIVGDAGLHKELAAGIKAGMNELHQVLMELRSGESGSRERSSSTLSVSSGTTVAARSNENSVMTATKAPDQPAPDNGTPTTLVRNRIFIVDDHTMMRQGLRHFISREEDFEICGEADSGTQALPRIMKLLPDAVIVDISLPGMNGIEFLKHLKTQLPEVVAVVVSMHDESNYAERALRAGAHGYVMKTEAVEEIVFALRHALKGEYHVSKSVKGAIFHKTLGVGGSGKSASVSPTEVLSDRELEVFELLGRGKSTRDIADILRLSGKTVETHRAHIKEKCAFSSNAEMIQHATIWIEHADGC